jgi:hypothetical protein
MMATKAQPEVVIKVTAEGAGGAADELGKVADAQEDVAKATEDAAAAAKKSADAAAGAGSKWSSLVAKLKAGAGAAASASAGLAGIASTLNTDMTEGTKLAVAGLQGLSGVLGAFGPIGQLAATGVSLVTAGIAALSGEAEKAYEPTLNLAEQYQKLGENASFAARTIGQMFSQIDQFAEVRKRIKDAGDLSVGIFGVPIEDVPTQWAAAAGAVQGSLTEARTAFAATQAELTTLQARRNGLDVSYYRAELERLEGLNEAARKNVQVRRDSLAAVVAAYKQTQAALGPELPAGGLPQPRSAGPKGKSRAEIEHEAYLRVNALRLEATAAVEAGVAAIEADYAARKEAAAQASAERLISLYAARAQADREITRMAAEEQAAAAAATQAEWESTFAKLEDSAAGFGKEMANAAAASLLFGASFSEVAEQALEALAVQAGGEALMEGARAVAALASYLFTPWNASLLASAKTHALAAAGFAAIAGGAAIGASAIGGGGGGGAGSAATAGAGGPPQAFGNERPEEPRESMINVNLAAGQGGRPLSRADGQAILGALAGLVRNDGGDR